MTDRDTDNPPSRDAPDADAAAPKRGVLLLDIEPAMASLLEATFPPASVTGTPKGRARELLRGWEPNRRGIYCGTVGLASPVAGCELNVAIRTVEFSADSTAVLGVGGGITADSDPGREWDECLHKAAPIVGDLFARQPRREALSEY